MRVLKKNGPFPDLSPDSYCRAAEELSPSVSSKAR
jgi:hypothetical protein